jgi:hypothetical protein
MTGAEVEKILPGRPYPRDCGILRERCGQHVPGLAPVRAISRTIVGPRVSGQRGKSGGVREGARGNKKPHLAGLI